VGREVSMIFIFLLFVCYYFWQAFNLFLTTLKTIAAAKKQMNTIIQVNWLEKKLAVL